MVWGAYSDSGGSIWGFEEQCSNIYSFFILNWKF